MNYGNQSNMAAMGQMQAAVAVEPRESRVESLLSMSANLIDQMGGLLSRLESLDQRLFGVDKRDGEKAGAPEPVRAPIDELEHRLRVVYMITQQCFDAVNRLDRL